MNNVSNIKQNIRMTIVSMTIVVIQYTYVYGIIAFLNDNAKEQKDETTI